MISDICHLNSDILYMIYEIWHMKYDIRHLTYDIWPLTYDKWHQTYDIYYPTSDIGHLTFGRRTHLLKELNRKKNTNVEGTQFREHIQLLNELSCLKKSVVKRALVYFFMFFKNRLKVSLQSLIVWIDHGLGHLGHGLYSSISFSMLCGWPVQALHARRSEDMPGGPSTIQEAPQAPVSDPICPPLHCPLVQCPDYGHG